MLVLLIVIGIGIGIEITLSILEIASLPLAPRNDPCWHIRRLRPCIQKLLAIFVQKALAHGGYQAGDGVFGGFEFEIEAEVAAGLRRYRANRCSRHRAW